MFVRFSTCVLLIAGVCLASDEQMVDRWARNLGSELWDLATGVARPEELRAKYRELNARVEEKSGENLVGIISESVGRMLRRKMDAVRCILQRAEDAAEEYDADRIDPKNITYISGKYSRARILTTNETIDPKIPENMQNDSQCYREMELDPDSHFYNIPVNTNHSSVHIPTNVYDLSPAVSHAIRWSEELDEVFKQNYRSDPALSWQYFGSMTGMLRQYPAMHWKTEMRADDTEEADLYDCRIRSWFIEAATCSKDMIILVDSSGSMEGMGTTIASAVIASILDTLSNNDFVTILRYSKDLKDVVPCFKDKLIQATPENIETFKEFVRKLDPVEIANLTDAFIYAFDLLKTYSDKRGCGPDTPCNQLIMLVTDGVASNISEVFDAWNRQENGTRIPVRVFTYLLGKEVTNVREIQLMACKNRGYYSHVHTQEEAQEQVLKYIPVVARPLVLQEVAHPIIWTHAYADVSMKKGEDPQEEISKLNTTRRQEYRLLTSVSIPAFDRKGNANNETRRANLLGVAGTDVPIKDIEKLTLPYKLGVNGYAFIVSNNGYVILHPDLRPVSGEKLKINYNSVDLTEVEILDDGRGPRDPGDEVLALRKALVDHERGSLKNVSVKLHYDDNRRVTLEKRDYYYAPLPGTPFGIAVAIPNYGKTWIKVANEIDKNRQAGINITDFFTGSRWRVHPGWVYCRYHYLEGHEMPNPEEELRQFLRKLGGPGWKWSEQYAEYDHNPEDEESLDCDKKVLEDDDYYCNKELMELLVFDAKATNQTFNEDFVYKSEEIESLAKDYGVFLRFVATQGGLTRWQYLKPESMISKPHNLTFGDLHRRAVNEPWYKGAIFQHEIDPDSISLSVPGRGGKDAVVTISMAIVPRDGGKDASAAVVGFQMPMTDFFNRFVNITSQSNNDLFKCTEEGIDCYLVDQNGYVVISEAHDDTGAFFGMVEGPVMQSMVKQGFFKSVDIYDYQAICDRPGFTGTATTLLTPFKYLWKIILWMFAKSLWMVSQFVEVPHVSSRAHDDDLPEKPPPPEEIKVYYTCDQMRILYMMNQDFAEKGITNSSIQCSRPFYAQRVPQTNLLLVVVNSLYSSCYVLLSTEPTEILPSFYVSSSNDSSCYKQRINDLPRRRLEGCFTEHPLEAEIDICGRGTRLQLAQILIIIMTIIKMML